MQFEINKTNIAAMISAFNKDKLAKGVRRRDAHGLDRFMGTFEAIDGEFRINSGHLTFAVRAKVIVAGAFTMRDAVFRELLATMRDDPMVSITALSEGLKINGSIISFGADDYSYSA